MSAQSNGEQLITACNGGNFPDVRSLVGSGTSADFQGGGGYTPAMHCCYGGHSEILQFLLEQGANASLTAGGGWAPLHWAAFCNAYECAAVLLRHGVTLDAINTFGRTALWNASSKGLLPIVQLLVQGGADIEIIADNDGQTPIVIARERGHAAVVAYLGFEINWRRRRNYSTVLNSVKGARR
jgi:ankyrin repeat protein